MTDKGNGGGIEAPSTPGFTRYVEKEDFDAFRIKMNTAMWGAEGRNGLVADVNGLKAQLRFWMVILTFIATIISPVFTALLLKYIVGV